jgi:Family of unknown function (DUF6152)
MQPALPPAASELSRMQFWGEIRMLRKIILTAAGSWALFCGPVSAHHAGSMYDHKRVESVSGSVKQWHWANPHAFLQIMVAGERGEPAVWSFESTSPSLLTSSGWRRSTFAPGDKVTVMYNPLLDGAPGGSLAGAILANGMKLTIGPPGPAPRPADAK